MIRVLTDPEETSAKIPSVAIDLSGAHSPGVKGTGFSRSDCDGLPPTAQDLTQTEAIDETVSYLEEVHQKGERAANLILEAPLSWAFTAAEGATRNDARLREVETRASYIELKTTSQRNRPWNINAGASTSLMALLFLNELVPRIPDELTVHLFEGFWSWVKKPKRHGDVARGLLEGLAAGGSRVVRLPDSSSSIGYRTALQLLDIPAEKQNQPPLIVFGHKDLANAFRPVSPRPLA